jgi:hypothetical protein
MPNVFGFQVHHPLRPRTGKCADKDSKEEKLKNMEE